MNMSRRSGVLYEIVREVNVRYGRFENKTLPWYGRTEVMGWYYISDK